MLHDTLRAQQMRGIHALKLEIPHKQLMDDVHALDVGILYDADHDVYSLAWFRDGDLQTYQARDRQDAYNTARAVSVARHDTTLMAAMLASR